MADVLLVTGFLSVITGVGLWSIPAALILAGVGLLYAGYALRPVRRG